MEFHLQQLAKHCRVCGKRLCKAKGRASVYQCTDHIADLFTSFGVNVSSDDDDKISPTKFCNPCYATMKRVIVAGKEGMPYTHTITPFVWTEHAPDCSVRTNHHTREFKLKYYYTMLGLSAL